MLRDLKVHLDLPRILWRTSINWSNCLNCKYQNMHSSSQDIWYVFLICSNAPFMSLLSFWIELWNFSMAVVILLLYSQTMNSPFFIVSCWFITQFGCIANDMFVFKKVQKCSSFKNFFLSFIQISRTCKVLIFFSFSTLLLKLYWVIKRESDVVETLVFTISLSIKPAKTSFIFFWYFSR